MARLVLLSFKSNEEAEILARIVCDPEAYVDVPDLLVNAEVEWVIGRPVNACECSQTRKAPGRRGKKVTSGWTKGQKYGWWIHPVKGCGRVSRLVLERFVANLTGGAYDLLPEILDEPERVPNDPRKFLPEGTLEHQLAR